MTQIAMQFMKPDCHELSDRLSAFLVSEYPLENRDALLGNDLGVSPRTARNYFNSIWPGHRAWKAIVRKFGRGVLDAVFAPEIDEVLARQAAEIQALERELESRKAHYRAVAGTADRVDEASQPDPRRLNDASS